MFPGDTDGAVWGPHFENHWPKSFLLKVWSWDQRHQVTKNLLGMHVLGLHPRAKLKFAF
jgi:hypothetical protein